MVNITNKIHLSHYCKKCSYQNYLILSQQYLLYTKLKRNKTIKQIQGILFCINNNSLLNIQSIFIQQSL